MPLFLPVENHYRMYRICIFCLLLILSCQAPSDSKNQGELNQATDVSNFRDSLVLRDLEGEKISIKTLNGKLVILNLWATWCGPCIREMPDLVEMQAELSEDFVLLLASDEEPERINRFLNNNTYDLEFVRIDNSIESLGVYALPTTFIIGKEGELVETLVGARDWKSPEQIQNIKNYLK